MGVKSEISIEAADRLFPAFNIQTITPTQNGIIDTTYIARSQTSLYILKKYEKAPHLQQQEEEELLKLLRQHSLNVPTLLAVNGEWRIFSYLSGISRPTLKTIAAAGRFLGKMHTVTQHRESTYTPFSSLQMRKALRTLRRHHPIFGLRLKKLRSFKERRDGTIHADLFPDNAKYDGSNLAVFDFIEAGNGSFALDLGVVASSWAMSDYRFRYSWAALMLKNYNRHAPKKISFETLEESIEDALLVYAMKRYLGKIEKKDSTLCYRTLYRKYQKFGFIQRKMKNKHINKQ